jgi:hypothetical protein
VESNHHSARRQGYSLLSSPVLSVRNAEGRPTGFEPVPRGSRPRVLPLHHSHREDWTGTTGLEPAAYRLTSERSSSELRPHAWRGWDSNPRSRAHEAREDSRSSTALDLSGRQESNLRSPAPEAGGVATLPHDQVSEVPPAGLEPAASGLRARRHRPFDHGGMRLRRQGSNLRLTINSRASFLSTTPERAEGEGVEPPRPGGPPVFETGYRTHGSPSTMAPAGVEPAPHRLRVGGSSC